MNKKLNKKIIISIILAIVLIIIILITKGVFFKNIKELIESKEIYLKIIKGIKTILIGLLVFLFADFIVSIGNNNKNASFKTISLLFGNILKYVSIIGMILVILSICGINTSTLVTASGILALIIGLGCQTLVSDIVSGIFMIFEGDIKIGDIVVINGWRGKVKQIGLRRTLIEDSVGNINIINNSSITNIINNTKELSCAICEVGIEYNESIERVEKIFNEHLHEFKKNVPAIVEGPFYKGVVSLGNSSVIIRLLAKCHEDDKFQVERDINREIKLLFDKYNINIPFNQVVVNYRDKE